MGIRTHLNELLARDIKPLKNTLEIFDAEVRRTKLVRFDDDWNETGEWTFPESVVRRFLPNSNSGGAFGPGGRLFVTGHDHAELYVLDVSANGGELKHIATMPAPIAGQGIAWDHDDPGILLGIVRTRHEVVFMRASTSEVPQW